MSAGTSPASLATTLEGALRDHDHKCTGEDRKLKPDSSYQALRIVNRVAGNLSEKNSLLIEKS